MGVPAAPLPETRRGPPSRSIRLTPFPAICAAHFQVHIAHRQRPIRLQAEPRFIASGVVKASKTKLRGGSKTRVIAISRSLGVVSVNGSVLVVFGPAYPP